MAYKVSVRIYVCVEHMYTYNIPRHIVVVVIVVVVVVVYIVKRRPSLRIARAMLLLLLLLLESLFRETESETNSIFNPLN